ncbi:MAG TPA: DNA-directed DNA polymerase [Candidatus Thermoplasmatota archaeon]|nr:DNA-directed DNA polymerase [Candidatus Thermoplasmatota archaeon]
MAQAPRPPPSTLEGMLLDVGYAPGGYQSRNALRLWIRTPEGIESVLDRHFEPYFWVLPKESASPGEVSEALSRLQVGDMRVVRAAVEERLWGLETRKCIRVVLQHPGHTPTLREVARKVPGVEHVLEADVPYIFRYLVDKRLRPMDGVRVTGLQRDAATGLLTAEAVEPFELQEGGALRMMAFDLEVRNPQVVPDTDKDPIVILSAVLPGKRVISITADGLDDRPVVEGFLQLVREEDPDIFLTYNGDQFDWPYLVGRAKKHGLKLEVGRDGTEPDIHQAGAKPAVRIAGRENVDLFRIAERDLPEVKVKTLQNVAEHLGIMDKEERTIVPKDEIASYWDDPELRKVLLAYALDDAVSTYGLAEAMLPLQVEIGRLIHQPLEEAARMGRGRQVDSYLMVEASVRGILAPNKGGGADAEMYEGGFVLEPKEGIHEAVQALDFSAMYPSLMIGYNISPDTYVGTDGTVADADTFVAPGVGHRFLKRPEGFFTSVLRSLVTRRKTLKKQMKELPKDSRARQLVDIRQQALKVMTNAVYGYMGWSQARWYSLETAEATTAWGRHLIQDVMAKAQQRGIEVIYGDTDSLFVRADLPVIEGFAKEVNASMPLELDLQERYEVIFFTGKKKRYAGLTEGGEIVVRGLEVRRGDWCELAKRLQREVLEIVLKARDPEAAANRVRDALRDLEEGRIPVEDLTIYKTLTMAPSQYKVRQAHVEALLRAQQENKDFRVPVGAKVGYVVLEANGNAPKAKAPAKGASKSAKGAKGGKSTKAKEDDSARARSKLAEFVTRKDTIDVGYYRDKQVLPAAMRILEHFGYDENALKGTTKQANLSKWF